MTTPANPPADLLAWLRWVLDQREAEARLLCALAGVSGTWLRDLLAEVDAKRRILDEHGPSGGDCRRCCQEADMQEFYDHETETETVEWERREMPYPCPTVRLLAIPFADRPGYRSEWAPA